MSNEVVLTTGPLGGLGDHLLYSSLPERFTKLGFDVYLDQDNVTRNDETFELIWARNPFVKGTTNRKPNIGYCKQGHYYDVANRFPFGSIEAMERAHGLLPPYSLAPRIYYSPQPYNIDLRNHVLVDFNAISSSIAPQGISDFMMKMNDRFFGRPFVMLNFSDGVVAQKPPIAGPSIRINSIYEYVDALASCYAWVGGEAGGQALAAAVRGDFTVFDLERRPEVVAVLSPKTYNSRGYTFRGVDYRITVHGNVSSDYWEPTEVPQHRYEMACRQTVEQARQRFKEEKGRERVS